MSDILEFIERYTQEMGWPPTRREIQSALDIASTSTVHSRLQELANAGEITIEPRKARGIRICR